MAGGFLRVLHALIEKKKPASQKNPAVGYLACALSSSTRDEAIQGFSGTMPNLSPKCIFLVFRCRCLLLAQRLKSALERQHH